MPAQALIQRPARRHTAPPKTTSRGRLSPQKMRSTSSCAQRCLTGTCLMFSTPPPPRTALCSTQGKQNL